MQLPPIILVGVLAAATAGFQTTLLPGAPAWTGAAILFGGLGLVVFGTAIIVRLGMRSSRPSPAAFVRASRATAIGRTAVLGIHVVAVLGLGWLDDVRGVLGDVILLDEVVAITPAVLALLCIWVLQYPIERRIRDALTIRRLDRGGPLYPALSRADYVSLQLRGGLLLLLVPILLILGLAEVFDGIAARVADASPESTLTGWPLDAAKFAGALSVLAVSPLLARAVLTVRPLPSGETRDLLGAVCARHRVVVRDILLWNTAGTMINAAVMGFLRPLRYVLLTDALIESMSRDEIRAVMAHEVGHVRRHHMPWLVVALMTALVGAAAVSNVALLTADGIGIVALDGAIPTAVDVVLLCGQVTAALLLFGWVSRRFERQADAFAVQHLSEQPEAEREALVTGEAVVAMQSALGRIAELNTIDPHRRSWRHGSIAWRQTYLQSLIGKPSEALEIDRLVRGIKLGSLAVLVTVVAIEAGTWWLVESRTPDEPAVAPATALAAALATAPATAPATALATALATAPAPEDSR